MRKGILAMVAGAALVALSGAAAAQTHAGVSISFGSPVPFYYGDTHSAAQGHHAPAAHYPDTYRRSHGREFARDHRAERSHHEHRRTRGGHNGH